MAKIEIGRTYKLDLGNATADDGVIWSSSIDKERAFINCHGQLAEVKSLHAACRSWCWVIMLSGPSIAKDIVVSRDWLSAAKIPCDCPLFVVLNRGCQYTSIHE